VSSLIEHKIAIGLHPLIKQRCYLVFQKMQEAIREEIENKILAVEIIEPSFSE